jgi:CheY-like chemotaxis protein
MSQIKGKILWIDDEIELLRAHIILLEQRGYSVDVATNGEDAIEMVKSSGYDLIFLDENMIGLSGLDTLPHLKEINPSLPVVMVTKNEAESVMEEAIGSKINDYLTKPVNPAQILAACKKYLETSRIEQDRLTQDYLVGFNQIQQRLYDDLNWDDWRDIYIKLVNWSMELDKYPSLGYQQTLQDQWRQCNSAFCKYVEEHYIDWINHPKDEDVPLFSHQITDKYLMPHLKSGNPVFFFVVDCMRLDQWLIMEEFLRQYYNVKKDYYSAMLPTATPYARNAIFAGLFPIDIQKHYPQYWVGELNSEDYKLNAFEKELLDEQLKRKRIQLRTPLNYIKIHDTDFGKKVENEISKYFQSHLTAIVVNAMDMIAHSRSDYAILKEIAPNESAYRSLTQSWFQHSSLYGMLKQLSEQKNIRIVLTTDHGSIRCMRGVKVLGDKETTTCLRYKFGRNVKSEQRHAMQLKDPTDFKLPHLGMTVNNIIAKEDYYFVYPTDYHFYLQRYRDSFQHGGISLEEMIVPIIELEPR